MSLFDEACQLDRQGSTEAARDAYLRVLQQDFGHAGALANLGALLSAGGYTSAARTVYAQAVAAHPDSAAARVNLANLLRLAGEFDLAQCHYAHALLLDPDCAEAHQGLAALLEDTDPQAAADHRARGFAGVRLHSSIYRGAGPPRIVLQLISARGGNIPTRQILDPHQFLTHTIAAEFADPDAPLPPHHIVFNAIGEADRCREALDAGARILAKTRAAIVNPPERVAATTRLEVARRLGALPGVVAPAMRIVPRSSLAHGPPEGFALPFLLRSPGFHTGQHFHRVETADALAAIAATLPGGDALCIECLDAREPDGGFHKYRVMFVGGECLPLHYAVSGDWKVHYFTADMADRPTARAREARFLADMPGVLGGAAMATLADIAATLGLDYAGIDFALAPDGRILLFEANAAMVIADPMPGPLGEYRRPAVERARAAVQQVLRKEAVLF
jgi:hypothetical protein